jgi:hypothetical protein
MELRWARHVARKGEIISTYISVGEPEGKTHSEDLGIDGRIILKYILRKLCGLDSSGT